MHSIRNTVRVAAGLPEVLEAITTTAGHRGWWADDCEVGRRAGDEAVYRFDAIEVAFRIDRLDGRGIAMTCVRAKDFPDWQGTRLSFVAVEDGPATNVELLHDGYPAKNAVYDVCGSQWRHYAESLRSYCETGRGAPYVSGNGGKGGADGPSPAR